MTILTLNMESDSTLQWYTGPLLKSSRQNINSWNMSPRQNEEKVYQKYICIIRTHFRTRSQKFFNVITFMISFHLSEQITDLEERKKTLQSQLYDIFAPLSAIYRRQPFKLWPPPNPAYLEQTIKSQRKKRRTFWGSNYFDTLMNDPSTKSFCTCS